MAEATLSTVDVALPDGAARSATADAGEYGGFWIRTLAYSADVSILIFGLTVIAVPFAFLGGFGMMISGLLAAFGPFAYFVWFTASGRQATFGKQLCGLKVEQADTGERISIPRSLGRELGKYVSAAVFCLGFLIVAFTRRKQGLHDLLATTVVVRAGPARILLALVVTFAGILVPIIVIALMFGAMFAALIGMVTGGMMGAMTGGDGMKHMNPAVPRIEQPAQRPRREAPLPQSSAAKPVLVAFATPGVPQSAPEPMAATPVKVETPKPEAVVAPPSKNDETKPAVAAASSRPRTPETVFVPPSSQAPAIEPKFNDLMTAVLYGDADAVAELLRLGKWPDKPDSQGVTPLMIARQNGDVRVAALLLEGGADPAPQQHGLR